MGSDDTQRPKRKATKAQADYLRIKRKRTRKLRYLWKTRPNLMEAIRCRATLAASNKVQKTNLFVADTVKEWPERFTAKELTQLALDLPYNRKNRKRRMPHASLVRRLRSMNLISYDPKTGFWVNNCK